MRAICSSPGCDRYAYGKGLCKKHYLHWHEANNSAQCRTSGCQRSVAARGLCRNHYNLWRRAGSNLNDPRIVEHERNRKPNVCSVADCGERRYGRGYCKQHYYNWKVNKDPLDATRSPIGVKRNAPDPTFRYLLPSGYVYVRKAGHPNASRRGLMSEHKYVMSTVLGRPLRAGETVHHKNGIRDDNRPENLELWATSHGPGQRVKDRVAWAIELLEQYADRPEVWPEGTNPQTWTPVR